MSTDVELPEEIREIAARLLHLHAVRAQIDTECNDLKAKLRATVTVGQRGTIDGRPVLAVVPNRRFDPNLARTVLPPELAEMCTVTVLDSKKAKAVLPPALYAACMREAGEPIVRTL